MSHSKTEMFVGGNVIEVPTSDIKAPSKYQAPKPSYSWLEWAKFIAPRVFFPPIILWDGMKAATNKALGSFVGQIVLQAQQEEMQRGFKFDIDSTNQAVQDTEELKKKGLAAEQFPILTHDKVELDTLEIQHLEETKKDIKNQKYIINFCGNAMCYQQIFDEMKDDAIRLQSHVIGFNYRGVGNSTSAARSANDLITDGIAQVQRLLDSGVDPENITLKAHSLGAGIGTLVTKYFHDKGQKINLFHSRSFSSITNNVVGWIRVAGTKTGHQESVGRKILGWIANPFIKFALALTKWEMDVVDAYKKIPATHKQYFVIRSSKERRERYAKDDPVIPHYASLHNALKDERRAIKYNIDMQLKHLHSDDPLIKPRFEAIKKDLLDTRNALKQRKMEAGSFTNGHVSSLNEMKNRYNGKTGQDHFDGFFKRGQKPHQELKNHDKEGKSIERSADNQIISETSSDDLSM